jgi:hypothetical protein
MVHKSSIYFKIICLVVWIGEAALQLISFHSTSKGFLGECGLRGGYFEMLGFPTEVKQGDSDAYFNDYFCRIVDVLSV